MSFIIKQEITITTSSGYKIKPIIIKLLKLIENTGSLNMAVKELGISYSHAWNTIYKINCHLEEPILITQRGGKGGGLATLTPTGRNLIQQYDQISQ